MKVECLHGYFRFTETSAGQLSKFASLFGLELARAAAGDHFTFADLVDAPEYSLPGGTFLGAPTTEVFEGKPWDVMRANGLIYDFNRGLVLPIASIIQTVSVNAAGNYFLSTGMILPGSLTDEGERVTDYAAFYIEDRANFKYSEITYE